MDKMTFLVELQRSIAMLDDAEQKDIVDEYAQHIDMKVSGGMTEAEAIADFGDFDDLVREVLGAYHVKAPADQPEAKPAEGSASLGAASPGAAALGAAAVREAAAQASAAAKRGTRKMSGLVKGVADGFAGKAQPTGGAKPGGSATRPGGDAAAGAASPSAAGVPEGEGVARADGRASAAAFSASRRASGLLGKLWTFARSCARWLWNILVALVAFSILLTALCFVFVAGMGTVLLAQGYPMLGVSIGSAGAAAALAALAYLATKAIVRKKKPGNDAPAVPVGSAVFGGAPVAQAVPTFYGSAPQADLGGGPVSRTTPADPHPAQQPPATAPLKPEGGVFRD